MSVEKSREYLSRYGLDGRMKILAQSSATVALAAEALGTEPARIAKSLTFMVNEKPVMILAAGDMKIDNPKYKAEFAAKAKMLSPDEVETLIGQTVGGVCPFGINAGVRVFLDQSLKRFDTVFPACGGSNTAIELTISELEQISGYEKWIDVCKAMV